MGHMWLLKHDQLVKDLNFNLKKFNLFKFEELLLAIVQDSGTVDDGGDGGTADVSVACVY